MLKFFVLLKNSKKKRKQMGPFVLKKSDIVIMLFYMVYVGVI